MNKRARERELNVGHSLQRVDSHCRTKVHRGHDLNLRLELSPFGAADNASCILVIWIGAAAPRCITHEMEISSIRASAEWTCPRAARRHQLFWTRVIGLGCWYAERSELASALIRTRTHLHACLESSRFLPAGSGHQQTYAPVYLVVEEAFDEWDYGKTKDGFHKYFNHAWEEALRSMVLRVSSPPMSKSYRA
eukprot:6184401-Pleurochrysis_carterae.AAC.1